VLPSRGQPDGGTRDWTHDTEEVDMRRSTSGQDPQARDVVADLFHVHHRRLVGLAALLVDDRGSAEEIVQDAFESLYRHWSDLRSPSSAVAYLDRAVVYAARSWIRRRITARAYVWPQADVQVSAEHEGLARGEHAELVAAVRALPRRQREVIVLRYFLDLSEAEIAAWLGVSPGSVKRHASRATENLQRRMEAWA
jgi:RNA polymerase sigma-70 factor (sigma-E family)